MLSLACYPGHRKIHTLNLDLSLFTTITKMYTNKRIISHHLICVTNTTEIKTLSIKLKQWYKTWKEPIYPDISFPDNSVLHHFMLQLNTLPVTYLHTNHYHIYCITYEYDCTVGTPITSNVNSLLLFQQKNIYNHNHYTLSFNQKYTTHKYLLKTYSSQNFAPSFTPLIFLTSVING